MPFYRVRPHVMVPAVKYLIASMAVAALGACDGAKRVGPNPAKGGVAVLTITELKFMYGTDLGVVLHPDGLLEYKGKITVAGGPTEEHWYELARLTPDGKVNHEGEYVGELLSDGSFKMADGQFAPFKLIGETLLVEGKKITLDDKGMFHGPDDGINVHVLGITDAGSKRTALLLAGLVAGGKVTSSAGPP